VAGIAALYLYFGRTKEPTKTGLIVPTARGFAF
jgi:hypothetical protein